MVRARRWLGLVSKWPLEVAVGGELLGCQSQLDVQGAPRAVLAGFGFFMAIFLFHSLRGRTVHRSPVRQRRMVARQAHLDKTALRGRKHFVPLLTTSTFDQPQV